MHHIEPVWQYLFIFKKKNSVHNASFVFNLSLVSSTKIISQQLESTHCVVPNWSNRLTHEAMTITNAKRKGLEEDPGATYIGRNAHFIASGHPSTILSSYFYNSNVQKRNQ